MTLNDPGVRNNLRNGIAGKPSANTPNLVRPPAKPAGSRQCTLVESFFRGSSPSQPSSSSSASVASGSRQVSKTSSMSLLAAMDGHKVSAVSHVHKTPGFPLRATSPLVLPTAASSSSSNGSSFMSRLQRQSRHELAQINERGFKAPGEKTVATELLGLMQSSSSPSLSSSSPFTAPTHMLISPLFPRLQPNMANQNAVQHHPKIKNNETPSSNTKLQDLSSGSKAVAAVACGDEEHKVAHHIYAKTKSGVLSSVQRIDQDRQAGSKTYAADSATAVAAVAGDDDDHCVELSCSSSSEPDEPDVQKPIQKRDDVVSSTTIHAESYDNNDDDGTLTESICCSSSSSDDGDHNDGDDSEIDDMVAACAQPESYADIASFFTVRREFTVTSDSRVQSSLTAEPRDNRKKKKEKVVVERVAPENIEAKSSEKMKLAQVNLKADNKNDHKEKLLPASSGLPIKRPAVATTTAAAVALRSDDAINRHATTHNHRSSLRRAIRLSNSDATTPPMDKFSKRKRTMLMMDENNATKKHAVNIPKIVSVTRNHIFIIIFPDCIFTDEIAKVEA
jgi:hypothetical protein